MSQVWVDGSVGGGGGCCLVCLVALPRRPLQAALKFGDRKPVDLFLKICELLSVPFSEIQQDWQQDFQNDKLPFCSNCLSTIQSVVGLQSQVDSLQKRISQTLENIRSKIRQTNSLLISGASIYRPVLTFRSKVLGNQSTFATPANSSTALLNTLFTSASTTSSSQPTWLPQHHLQEEHIFISQPPSQLFTYTTSVPAPISLEIQTSPPASSQSPYSTTIPQVFIQQPSTIIEVSSVTPTHSEYPSTTTDYFDDDANEAIYTSSEETSTPKPPKRQKKKDSQQPTTPRGRGRPSTKSPSSKSTSTPTPSKRSTTSSTRQSEYFSPITTDPLTGHMLFENITIIPHPPGGYYCGLCNALIGKSHDSISLRKTKIHIKGFHLKAYQCSQCSKNFTSADILSQHITRTHELGDEPCSICGKPIRPRYMQLHQFTHMNATEKEQLIATGFKPPESLHNKEKKYPCPTCGVMFKKMSNLRVHEGTHMDEKTRPRFKCEHCDKSYTNQQTLKDHITKNHTDSVRAEFRQKALCKVCGKSVFVRAMGRHLKTHVPKEQRPFSCSVCGKRFSDGKVLKRHEEKMHADGDSKEKYPFACDICGKRSGSKRKVRMHRRRVHKDHWRSKVPASLLEDVSVDGEEEWRELEDLNREGLQHVKGDDVYAYQLYEMRKVMERGRVTYKCSTCWDVLEGEEEVISHVRERHMGRYRCNLCTKRMKNLTEVVAHKREEHEGLVSWRCKVCGKPGLTKKSREGHKWSHLGVEEAGERLNGGDEMPGQVNRGDKGPEEREKIRKEMGDGVRFKCGVCGKEIEGLGELQRHRKREHGKEVGEKGEETRRRGKRRSKRKEEEEQSAEVMPEGIVKVEIVTDEEDDTEEEEEEDDDSEEEEDSEFKSKMRRGGATTTTTRRVGLRERRPSQRMINYAEEEQDDEEDSAKESGNLKRRPRRRIVVQVKREVEDDENSEGNREEEQNEDEDVIMLENELKRSPQTPPPESGDEEEEDYYNEPTTSQIEK